MVRPHCIPFGTEVKLFLTSFLKITYPFCRLRLSNAVKRLSAIIGATEFPKRFGKKATVYCRPLFF